MNQPAFLPVYRRAQTVMARGEGMYLFDDAGKRYLDCSAGIAVNALGHSHPHLVEALKQQAEKLWHCSNNYTTQILSDYAQRLMAQSKLDGGVFFCSSGAEAVDSMIKFIRRTHYVNQTGRHRVITFHGGFHGRAMSCISAGGNETAREGYGPLLEGFDQIAFNDIEAVKAAITDETAAILLEPVQGEGGVYPADPDFMRQLRALCDEHGMLLCFDEVQCGFGRCGSLFTYDRYDVVPDLMTCAKGIGNGFPLAAVIASQKVRDAITPGCHGSTYGSNPLALAVGNAVLDVMLQDGFFEQVQRVGDYLKAQLEAVQRDFPQAIAQVRGFGLMLGLQMTGDARALANVLREEGLLVAPAYGDVLRFTPPLIMEESHADEAVAILRKGLMV
jgi:predicted acetylornithine/succinylornithine family transaminase